jgi:hypothetical protein
MRWPADMVLKAPGLCQPTALLSLLAAILKPRFPPWPKSAI